MSKDKKREYVREHPYKVKEKLMDMRYRRVKVNANRMSKKELCDIIQKKKLEKECKDNKLTIDSKEPNFDKYENGIVVKIEELRFEYDWEDF